MNYFGRKEKKKRRRKEEKKRRKEKKKRRKEEEKKKTSKRHFLERKHDSFKVYIEIPNSSYGVEAHSIKER